MLPRARWTSHPHGPLPCPSSAGESGETLGSSLKSTGVGILPAVVELPSGHFGGGRVLRGCLYLNGEELDI